MTRESSPSGYSGTPLPKKLGLVKGQVALLIDPPEGHPESWGDLPEGFSFTRARKPAKLDVIVRFVTTRDAMAEGLPGQMAALDPAGTIWIGWPKKTPAKGFPKVETDITEDVIREVALPLGLVDVKVCAIDGTRSGLKLVLRKELRPDDQKPKTRTRSPKSTKRIA